MLSAARVSSHQSKREFVRLHSVWSSLRLFVWRTIFTTKAQRHKERRMRKGDALAGEDQRRGESPRRELAPDLALSLFSSASCLCAFVVNLFLRPVYRATNRNENLSGFILCGHPCACSSGERVSPQRHRDTKKGESERAMRLIARISVEANRLAKNRRRILPFVFVSLVSLCLCGECFSTAKYQATN
jgi:hypothetical protein